MMEKKKFIRRCIVCDKELKEYSTSTRKFCRLSNCRKLFLKLKKKWLKKTKKGLKEEEIIIYDKLLKDGDFDNSIRPEPIYKPFILLENNFLWKKIR